jgi:hypothetical protein
MGLFFSTNAPMPTTAPQTPLATGTAIKTHQQIAVPSTQTIGVMAFGVEFATALTAPATVELVETNVAATVTAHVAAGVQPYDAAAIGGTTSMTLSTTGTGYNASAEGAITATRTAKLKILPIGATEMEWEWTPGREFTVQRGFFLRVRISTGVTINVTTWIAHIE